MIIFFLRSFLSARLKIRAIVFTVFILSVIITSFIFLSLTIIQKDVLLSNNRFCKDLGGLFTTQILATINLKDDNELLTILEKMYLSTSSIRYIILFRTDGSLFSSFPIYYSSANNILSSNQHLYYLPGDSILFNIPLVIKQKLFDNNIPDIIIPLIYNGYKLGIVELGINTNIIHTKAYILIYALTILVFFSIWLVAVILSYYNSLAIVYPVKELLIGMTDIASGHFKQRIDSKEHSHGNHLIISFNEMAKRLEFYENNNTGKLSLEKHKLESIVSKIADGAILVDTDLRVLFVNQVAAKAFNWNNLDVIGKYIGLYLPSHINQSLSPLFNSLVKRNCFDILDSPTQEICINLDYASHKIFRFILTAILDKKTSMLTSIAIIMQDISCEVQLNDAKNQFIGNVSHELRTPLCNIGSFLETLLDYSSSLTLEQQINFLSIANNETKRLGRLVNDILDLSRLESDFNYTLKSVNIIDILYSVVNTSQLIASKNNIRLKLEIDYKIKYVLGHESLLFQVVSNLVSNAIKFTNNNGYVVLRLYLLSSLSISKASQFFYHTSINLVRVEVIDEGLGIDKLDHKTIFDRFVRIEDNVHTLQGTGLGLSIVENILSKHKTFICIQSELFVGTSFYFDLLEFK